MLFIIGNGFDLALGLKTSYRDFIDWYITQNEEPEDKRIRNFKDKIKDDLKENINSWADLEIRLGEYTNQYDENEVGDFLSVYRNMKEKLNDYIKDQENQVDLSHVEEIRKESSHFLFSFYDDFPGAIKSTLKNALEMRRNNITYNFLSFNYTHTLDSFLDSVLKPLKVRQFGSFAYQDKIGEVIHIHGEIDKPLLLGIDSYDQIKNEAFRRNAQILRAIVKPQTNKEMQENIEEKARNLINKSQIICLFGVSIGNSDISWWKKLGVWLKSSGTRILIIFWHSSEVLSPLHYDIRLTKQDDVKKYFIKQAGLPNDDFGKIGNQIIVHIHTNFFNIKITPEEQIINHGV